MEQIINKDTKRFKQLNKLYKSLDQKREQLETKLNMIELAQQVTRNEMGRIDKKLKDQGYFRI